VVYTAVDDPSPNFGIVLIFTEILPICALIVLLCVNTAKPERLSDQANNGGSADKDTRSLFSSSMTTSLEGVSR
jgi:hypothetical protein